MKKQGQRNYANAQNNTSKSAVWAFAIFGLQILCTRQTRGNSARETKKDGMKNRAREGSGEGDSIPSFT